MRILFWNTGNRPVVDLLGDLGRLRNPDVIVLAETADPIRNVVSRLNKDARQVYSSAHDSPASVRRPLHVLTRLPKGRIEALRDDAGVAVKRVRPIIGPDFTMVAVHLGSKLFRTQEDQAFAAASINRDIEGIEHRVGHRRTMVIGDFNMSPFELGLVSSDCFHAVMSRQTAQRQSRRVDNHTRCFFYNPTWNHFCSISSRTTDSRFSPGSDSVRS